MWESFKGKKQKEQTNKIKRPLKAKFSKDIYDNFSSPKKERNKENPLVFFNIKIRDKESKRIEIELFKDKVPKISENFRCLCTREKGEKMHYKGSKFNKMIRNFIIKGGDINNSDIKRDDITIYYNNFDDKNIIIYIAEKVYYQYLKLMKIIIVFNSVLL